MDAKGQSGHRATHPQVNRPRPCNRKRRDLIRFQFVASNRLERNLQWRRRRIPPPETKCCSRHGCLYRRSGSARNRACLRSTRVSGSALRQDYCPGNKMSSAIANHIALHNAEVITAAQARLARSRSGHPGYAFAIQLTTHHGRGRACAVGRGLGAGLGDE
jgi:hypothetical protein